MSPCLRDPVAARGRPREWPRRGRPGPSAFAWRPGRFRWIPSAARWKGAIRQGEFARAGCRAPPPTTCATAALLAVGGLLSSAFPRAADRADAPRSKLPAVHTVPPGVPADGFPRERAWQLFYKWRWLWW